MGPVTVQPGEGQSRQDICLLGLMRAYWHLSVFELHAASQGYQAGAKQIRRLIFSLANGAPWIMSWCSPVSSSVRFVARRGGVADVQGAAFQVRSRSTS